MLVYGVQRSANPELIEPSASVFAPLGLADIRPKTNKNSFNRCKENRLLILREGLNKSTESGTLNLNLPFSHPLRLGMLER